MKMYTYNIKWYSVICVHFIYDSFGLLEKYTDIWDLYLWAMKNYIRLSGQKIKSDKEIKKAKQSAQWKKITIVKNKRKKWNLNEKKYIYNNNNKKKLSKKSNNKEKNNNNKK